MYQEIDEQGFLLQKQIREISQRGRKKRAIIAVVKMAHIAIHYKLQSGGI